jgi:hypothetical protein
MAERRAPAERRERSAASAAQDACRPQTADRGHRPRRRRCRRTVRAHRAARRWRRRRRRSGHGRGQRTRHDRAGDRGRPPQRARAAADRLQLAHPGVGRTVARSGDSRRQQHAPPQSGFPAAQPASVGRQPRAHLRPGRRAAAGSRDRHGDRDRRYRRHGGAVGRLRASGIPASARIRPDRAARTAGGDAAGDVRPPLPPEFVAPDTSYSRDASGNPADPAAAASGSEP